MANISLEGSIRTCKIDSGWANKLQSDRFLNPNQMLCPVWNQVDTSGRPVCRDSFYTKTPGCNSAGDRVLVENDLRPQYIEYVTLDAAGIRGGQQCPPQASSSDTQCHQASMRQTHNYTGQYGLNTGFSQNIQANCATCRNLPDQQSYQSNSMRQAQWARQAQAVQNIKRNSMMF
jgi:hypothetical protein